jgi:hypothetical protein
MCLNLDIDRKYSSVWNGFDFGIIARSKLQKPSRAEWANLSGQKIYGIIAIYSIGI